MKHQGKLGHWLLAAALLASFFLISAQAVWYLAERVEIRYGVVDLSGTIIVEPRYHRIYPTRDEDRYIVARLEWGGYLGNVPADSEYRWGVVDGTGSVVIQPEFDKIDAIVDSADRQSFIVGRGGKKGLIDGKGVPLTGIEFDSIRSSRHGYAVKKDGQWHHLREDGSVGVDVAIDEAQRMSDGVAWSKLNGRRPEDSKSLGWTTITLPALPLLRGLADRGGRVAIEPRYLNIDEVIGENRVWVQTTESKWGLLDIGSSQFVVEPRFDDLQRMGLSGEDAANMGLGTSDLRAILVSGHGFGVMNTSGVWVVPARYDRIDSMFSVTFPSRFEEKAMLTGILAKRGLEWTLFNLDGTALAGPEIALRAEAPWIDHALGLRSFAAYVSPGGEILRQLAPWFETMNSEELRSFLCMFVLALWAIWGSLSAPATSRLRNVLVLLTLVLSGFGLSFLGIHAAGRELWVQILAFVPLTGFVAWNIRHRAPSCRWLSVSLLVCCYMSIWLDNRLPVSALLQEMNIFPLLLILTSLHATIAMWREWNASRAA